MLSVAYVGIFVWVVDGVVGVMDVGVICCGCGGGDDEIDVFADVMGLWLVLLRVVVMIATFTILIGSCRNCHCTHRCAVALSNVTVLISMDAVYGVLFAIAITVMPLWCLCFNSLFI